MTRLPTIEFREQRSVRLSASTSLLFDDAAAAHAGGGARAAQDEWVSVTARGPDTEATAVERLQVVFVNLQVTHVDRATVWSALTHVATDDAHAVAIEVAASVVVGQVDRGLAAASADHNGEKAHCGE